MSEEKLRGSVSPGKGSPWPLHPVKIEYPPRSVDLTVDTFKPEIASALETYDRYVVCLDKIPEDCETALYSLMEKAIHAYVHRGANLRHGIALDRQVTIILSQTEGDRPLCGIYFNLHSPYSKKSAPKPEIAAG